MTERDNSSRTKTTPSDDSPHASVKLIDYMFLSEARNENQKSAIHNPNRRIDQKNCKGPNKNRRKLISPFPEKTVSMKSKGILYTESTKRKETEQINIPEASQAIFLRHPNI